MAMLQTQVPVEIQATLFNGYASPFSQQLQTGTPMRPVVHMHMSRGLTKAEHLAIQILARNHREMAKVWESNDGEEFAFMVEQLMRFCVDAVEGLMNAEQTISQERTTARKATEQGCQEKESDVENLILPPQT